MKFIYHLLLLLFFCLCLSAQFSSDLQKKLDANLKELIPVNITLEKQYSVAVLAQRLQIQTRQNLIKNLKKQTAKTQKPIVKFCQYLQIKYPKQIQNVRPLWLVNIISLKATPEVIRQIAKHRGISFIHLDPMRKAIPDIKTERATKNEQFPPYGVKDINAPQVWSKYQGKGIIVAVLDTGVYPHEDFAKRMVPGKSYYPNVPDANDDHGHGTHCAGTVAGKKTGVAPAAQIMPVKVLNRGGSGKQSDVWDAMGWASENSANVLSMSIGWRSWKMYPQEADNWELAVKNAQDLGAIVVVAAGNESVWGIRYPGAVYESFTIGACDENANIASFSSVGPVEWVGSKKGKWNKPDVIAPGVKTLSTRKDGGYVKMSGTSMATPHTAGAIALLLSAQKLKPANVKKIIKSSSQWMPGWGNKPSKEPNNTYGYGRIDIAKAIDVLNNK